MTRSVALWRDTHSMSIRQSHPRFRKNTEISRGNFTARHMGEWDDQGCVLAFLERLSAEHVLNDAFSTGVFNLLSDEAKYYLEKEFLRLNDENVDDESIREELDANAKKPKKKRPPNSSQFEYLFGCARHFCDAKQIREVFKTALIMSGSMFPKAVELASVSSLSELQRIFLLDENDLLILAFFYSERNSEEFMELTNAWNVAEFFYGLSICTGISEDICREHLCKQSKLIKSGIIRVGESHNINGRPFITTSVFSYITVGGNNSLFGSLLELDTDESFPLESFPVDALTRKIVISLLQSTGENSAAHILLYGKEGSGKTKFAKALVEAAGKKLYVYHQTGEGKNTDASDDLFNLSLVTSSADNRDSVILIDEAEDVLATGSSGGFFSQPAPAYVKGRVHDILDNSRCSVIWIVNHTQRMDASTKRRFSFSIEFHPLSSSAIKNLARTYIEGLGLSENLQERIVALSGNYGLTAASLQYLHETVSCLVGSVTDEEEILCRVRCLFESNVRLLTGTVPVRPVTGEAYSVEVLNTSVSADRLVELSRKALARIESSISSGTAAAKKGMRFLFYGESGTGKTELARYISEALERPLLLKRASDILDPYVGQSEQNVSKMFREAKATHSILLLDEADSFFYDRAGATKSWERTLVNEFLTQMEEFPGIMICTTNLATILDKALARRFHQSVEFKGLTSDSVGIMVSRYFPEMELTETQLRRIFSAGSVTPGDFAALKGRTDCMDDESITAEYVSESLREIVQAKKDNEKITIGFMQ